jgi:hypothetical protein
MRLGTPEPPAAVLLSLNMPAALYALPALLPHKKSWRTASAISSTSLE